MCNVQLFFLLLSITDYIATDTHVTHSHTLHTHALEIYSCQTVSPSLWPARPSGIPHSNPRAARADMA